LRKLLAVAVTATMLVLAVPALAATRTVKVGDNWFVRDGGVPTVTVSKGTTVKWVWKGSKPHNVHALSGPRRFASPVQKSGTFKKKLPKGTYKIVCDVHGAGDQSMKLVVR
jgi:plastocyanin